MLHRAENVPSRGEIRFFHSVSFRLLVGLLVVAVLSIASILAAILTLRATAASNDEIAASELPYLSAASQLSQKANLIASVAHTLAAAKTDFQLRAERNKIDGTLNTLDGFLEEIRLHGEAAPLSAPSSREMIELVQQRRDELVANVNALNKSVAARIKKIAQFSKKILELQSAMAEIRGIVAGAAEEPDGGYLDAWTKHFDEAASEAFSLPIWTNAKRVEQSRARVKGILDAMGGESRQLTDDAGDMFNAKWRPVEAVLGGKDNMFDARLDLIDLDRSIERNLSEGSFISSRFISAVSDVYFDAQAEFDRTNRSISSVVNRVTTILAATGGVTIVLIILLVLFVRYSVIDRLTRLKTALQHHFQGEETEIPTKGNDELAEIGGALAYFVDEISEREERLVHARQDAETANSAKSEFLAVVSHELRTPMYGVLAMGRFLLESDLNEEQHDYASSIIRSGETLLALLNGILDFSKIEAGKLELDIAEFDLPHEIDAVDSLISRSALPKGLVFKVSIAPDVPLWLVGDAVRIRQVLINLAGNAVKFTDQGEISIDVTAIESPEREQCTLRFAVTDTGVGIDKETQRNLFQPFSQADASTARKYGGTGLGLSISRRLVELMGGTIGVESEPGRGSTFHFTVPLELVPSDRIEELALAETATVRDTARYRAPDLDAAREANAVVLVAEDNATNRKIIERLMARLGYVCDIVEDGRAAWQAYRAKDYGLILTDCRMPVMDGFELTTRIREHEKTGSSRTPIIALTADALQQTKEHCRRVGMDDTLTKPVDFSDLDKIIGSWLPAAVRLRTRLDPTDAMDRDVAKPGHTDVLDVTPLLAAFGEINDDALDVLGNFIESADVQVRTIIKCIDDIDITELRDVTHALKGDCLSLGGTKLGHLLQQLEADMRGVADMTRKKPEIGSEWETLAVTAERLIRGEGERGYRERTVKEVSGA